MSFSTYEVISEDTTATNEMNELKEIADSFQARLNPVGECRVQLLCEAVVSEAILSEAASQNIEMKKIF